MKSFKSLIKYLLRMMNIINYKSSLLTRIFHIPFWNKQISFRDHFPTLIIMIAELWNQLKSSLCRPKKTQGTTPNNLNHYLRNQNCVSCSTAVRNGSIRSVYWCSFETIFFVFLLWSPQHCRSGRTDVNGIHILMHIYVTNEVLV